MSVSWRRLRRWWHWWRCGGSILFACARPRFNQIENCRHQKYGEEAGGEHSTDHRRADNLTCHRTRAGGDPHKPRPLARTRSPAGDLHRAPLLPVACRLAQRRSPFARVRSLPGAVLTMMLCPRAGEAEGPLPRTARGTVERPCRLMRRSSPQRLPAPSVAAPIAALGKPTFEREGHGQRPGPPRSPGCAG